MSALKDLQFDPSMQDIRYFAASFKRPSSALNVCAWKNRFFVPNQGTWRGGRPLDSPAAFFGKNILD